MAVAAAIVISSRPLPAAPSAAVGVERTATPEPISVYLPETRGSPVPSSPEPTHVLDVDGLRVALPRLGIDLPLAIGDPERDVPRAGFAGATPEFVALVYPGSRSPADGGNTYIYAHARSSMFLSLWNAALGENVLIIRADGSVARSYQVALIVPRVDPTDTHWLDPSGIERLTLQTSTGPRPDDPRFIVVAYPIDGNPVGGRLP